MVHVPTVSKRNIRHIKRANMTPSIKCYLFQTNCSKAAIINKFRSPKHKNHFTNVFQRRYDRAAWSFSNDSLSVSPAVQTFEDPHVTL